MGQPPVSHCVDPEGPAEGQFRVKGSGDRCLERLLKVAGRWELGCRWGVVTVWRGRERRRGRRGSSWRSHGLERVAGTRGAAQREP